jgi:putative lipase involved disintegration of autophagic bodies
MRAGATLRLAFIFGSAALMGCTFKLSQMAHDQGKSSIGCDDTKYKMRPMDAEKRRVVVYGCGEFEVYEGNCNGEENGCDHGGMTTGCDGSCRVRRTTKGQLTEEGEIPEWALKGEDPPEE